VICRAPTDYSKKLAEPDVVDVPGRHVADSREQIFFEMG
jgi:hypothetical protein